MNVVCMRKCILAVCLALTATADRSHDDTGLWNLPNIFTSPFDLIRETFFPVQKYEHDGGGNDQYLSYAAAPYYEDIDGGGGGYGASYAEEDDDEDMILERAVSFIGRLVAPVAGIVFLILALLVFNNNPILSVQRRTVPSTSVDDDSALAFYLSSMQKHKQKQ